MDEINGGNLYLMGENNLVMWIDLLGLRVLYVYIWESKRWGPMPRPRFVSKPGSVGHVMITEGTSRTAILSQYPHAYGGDSAGHGPNILFDFEQTMATSGRPDKIFKVTIPDDIAFDRTAKQNIAPHRPWWDWLPERRKGETHCARAGYDALKAGGLPLIGQDAKPDEWEQILPGTLGDLLDRLAAKAKAANDISDLLDKITIGSGFPNVPSLNTRPNWNVVRLSFPNLSIP
jgi:hypothetical protein